MISAVTGELRRVDEDRVQLNVGALTYELLVPAADLTELQVNLGEQVTFHTILYLEGDPNRGNLEPRLIGFLRPEDRKFFDRFTTVKGIGPKTALRALTIPVGQIAQAIEAKDARFLVQLQGIGKRTAELIIAELSGKVKDFATGYGERAASPAPGPHRPVMEEDAIAALLALGERRPDAERLLERAKQSKPDITTTATLVREMLSLRNARV
ncbi:MAG TPA: Holliday junction branch migration protein RuvA [Tepidisphaeraceae bacterium]